MLLTVSCPYCNHRYRVAADLNGRRVKCRACDGRFRIGVKPVQSPPVIRRGRFRCPYCASEAKPVWRSKRGTSGLIVFLVLLVVFFPLCWIGLLMKDHYRVCADCRMKLYDL
jgi:hypothetical protein